MMPHVAKAMGAIEKCGTGKLGAHEEVCDNWWVIKRRDYKIYV